MVHRTWIRRFFKGLLLLSMAALLAAWLTSLWLPLRMSKGGFKPRISAGVIIWPILGPHKTPIRPTNYGFISPTVRRAKVVVDEEVETAVQKGRRESRSRKWYQGGEWLEPLRLTRNQLGNSIPGSLPRSYGYTDSGVLILVDKNGWYLGEGVFDTNRIRFEDYVGFTNRVTVVEIPVWMPASIILAAAVFLWRREISAMLRRLQIPSGHCRKCGYNLTGNVSGRCPECGILIEQQAVTS